MPKAKDEVAQALESCGIGLSSPDFLNAKAALKAVCESSGMGAMDALAALKESAATHSYAAMDELLEVRKKIEDNEKEIDRLGKRVVDAKKSAEWMLNVPEKETEAPVMSMVGRKLHEYIVNAYYTWKISREENEIAKLETENRKLQDEAARLASAASAVKIFKDMARDSTLAGEPLRKGAEAIEKRIGKVV